MLHNNLYLSQLTLLQKQKQKHKLMPEAVKWCQCIDTENQQLGDLKLDQKATPQQHCTVMQLSSLIGAGSKLCYVMDHLSCEQNSVYILVRGPSDWFANYRDQNTQTEPMHVLMIILVIYSIHKRQNSQK